MKKWKKLLALVLAMACITVMNGNPLTSFAANTAEIAFDGNGGSFDYKNGSCTFNTKGLQKTYTVGTSMKDSGDSIKDPVFFDPARKFLGWQIGKYVERTDDGGNTYNAFVPEENIPLFTTTQAMEYVLPNVDYTICFEARWDGNDDDYFSQVYIHGYNGHFKYKFSTEDTMENTASVWGNYLKESGETIKEQTKDYFFLSAEPSKTGAVFEGWAEFKVIKGTDPNNPDYEKYELNGTTIYTTEQMLNRVVPDYDVAYVAKWSDTDLEDYFANQITPGEQNFYVINANGGKIYFNDTLPDGTKKEMYVPERHGNHRTDLNMSEAFTYQDDEFVSVKHPCGTFKDWTIYTFSKAEFHEIPKGSEPNWGDEDLTTKFLSTVIYDDGRMVDQYLDIWNMEVYKTSVTTTEMLAQVADQPYYIEANWKNVTHRETYTMINNFVDATESQPGSYEEIEYCSHCGAELSRTLVPITITSQAITVTGIDDPAKVEIKTVLTTVPEELKNIFSSTNDISATMKNVVVSGQNGLTGKAKVDVLDVALKVQKDDGSWEKVDNSNFPAEGISILLPYPAGIDPDNYEFVVTHMFTTGNNAGSVETLNVIKEQNGLRVTVTSLSPIGIAYEINAQVGDVNKDSNMDANDALEVLKHVAKMITFGTWQEELADVNGDSEIDANDALWILKKVVGLL